MAKKRSPPDPHDLQRQIDENRAAIRAIEEMVRASQREVEEARIARLDPKHRPRRRAR